MILGFHACTQPLNFDFPVRKNRKIEVQSANRRRRGAISSGRMAPHFLTARNGGKNREGLCPFEPHAFFSTSDLRPLSPVTAGQICADAQDWPAGGGNIRN